MAKLRFNLHGYVFEKGLADIRRAYDATIATLEKQHMDRVGDSLEFQRALAAGETGPSEYDESGEKLYDYEQLHEMLIEEMASSILVAREAYVVILHHYWEKRCDEWMQTKGHYDSTRAHAWLGAHGLTIDHCGLATLREASNTIKHNNAALFKRRPDLFKQPGPRSGSKVDYANWLQLNPTDINRMFEAVKTSGIQIDTEFAPSFMPQERLHHD